MNAREAHDRAVQKLAEKYEGEGFTVQKEAEISFPDGGRYRADLLAEREGEHVVVEVKLLGTSGDRPNRKWGEIAKQIKSRHGWHFKIVPVERQPADLPDLTRIRDTLTSAEVLLREGHAPAALLLSASAFEASARKLLVLNDADVGYKAGHILVEQLVSEGLLEQEDFVPLRAAMDRRNEIAHGFLADLPTGEMIHTVIEATKRLLEAAADQTIGNVPPKEAK